MDSTAREVLVMLLGCLRTLEKRRQEQVASLTAALMILVQDKPAYRERHRALKQKTLDALAGTSRDIDEVFVGLIGMLKNPDPPEEDEQERLRRLLESFEGPKQ